jgi:hypothetical protein
MRRSDEPSGGPRRAPRPVGRIARRPPPPNRPSSRPGRANARRDAPRRRIDRAPHHVNVNSSRDNIHELLMRFSLDVAFSSRRSSVPHRLPIDPPDLRWLRYPLRNRSQASDIPARIRVGLGKTPAARAGIARSTRALASIDPTPGRADEMPVPAIGPAEPVAAWRSRRSQPERRSADVPRS